MSENVTQKINQVENQIEVRKKVFLYIHNDGFDGKNLEPIILVDGDRIHIVFLKRKYNGDMYYVFDSKKYIKLWNDKKGNLLIYVDNWGGELFISNPQKTEYIDYLSYTVSQEGLICEDREGKRKKLILQGFDILPLIVNEFEENANAILYIICTKLS